MIPTQSGTPFEDENKRKKLGFEVILMGKNSKESMLFSLLHMMLHLREKYQTIGICLSVYSSGVDNVDAALEITIVCLF